MICRDGAPGPEFLSNGQVLRRTFSHGKHDVNRRVENSVTRSMWVRILERPMPLVEPW